MGSQRVGNDWVANTFRIEKNDMNSDLCDYINKLTKVYRRDNNK